MHTPMHKIDWFKLYKFKTQGKLLFDLEETRKQELPFFKLVKKFVKRKGRILDAGTGLGRMALLLSLSGYSVTAIDKDERMLAVAKRNAVANKGKVRFSKGDLTNLKFRKNAFDAIVHQGIIEHYSVLQARRILRHHLSIAPLVIFSVPVHAHKTHGYFKGDGIKRNLKSVSELRKLLKGFNLLEIKVAVGRTRNLMAVVAR